MGDVLAPLGLAAMAPLTAVKAGHRASKMVGYDPIPMRQRPWHDDYKEAVGGHGAGGPLTSPEGVVIDAPVVAGRRGVGQGDTGLRPDEVYDVGSAIVQGRIGPASARQLGEDVGRYHRGATADRPEPSIEYLNSLSDVKRPRVVAHEIGHAIDDLAASIDTKGLGDELRQVYHDLATGQQGRKTKRTQPDHLGYRGGEVDAEYMAEAIRAYMVDPNYLKSVAPKTAKAIREAVNENPRIARIIQFNAETVRSSLPGTVINAAAEKPKGFARGGAVTGGLRSPVPGRTDALPIDVPEGSYVIPADIVSGLGDGNTEAGMRLLEEMFKGPYGVPAGPIRRHKRIPRPRRVNGGAVPIAAAGGEFIVPPEAVEVLGDGDLAHGHRVLDEFVQAARGAIIQRTAALPAPQK